MHTTTIKGSLVESRVREVEALLDSGATGLFMDTTFAKEKGFKMEKLKKPLLVRNVDGMANTGEGYNIPGRVQYVL